MWDTICFSQRLPFVHIVANVATTDGKDVLSRLTSAPTLDDAITDLNHFHMAVNGRLGGQAMDIVCIRVSNA